MQIYLAAVKLTRFIQYFMLFFLNVEIVIAFILIYVLHTRYN